jgi:hypothetical protein
MLGLVLGMSVYVLKGNKEIPRTTPNTKRKLKTGTSTQFINLADSQKIDL